MTDLLWGEATRSIRVDTWVDAEWGWQSWEDAWVAVEAVS